MHKLSSCGWYLYRGFLSRQIRDLIFKKKFFEEKHFLDSLV